MNLNWSGFFYDLSGYGYMNRAFVKGLSNYGLNPKIEVFRSEIQIEDDELAFLENMRRTHDDPAPDILVCGHLPLDNLPESKFKICYTMIETQNVSKSMVDKLNRNYDACWVPTRWQQGQFRASGVNIPVSVLPIPVGVPTGLESGFSIDFQYHCISSDKAPHKPQGFKFLSVGRWNFRKGFDCLIKAYLQEFNNQDNASLILFTRHPSLFDGQGFDDVVLQEIEEIYKKYSNHNSPPIYVCSDKIPECNKLDIFWQGDSFVLPSRGEGYCIPILEASLSGLPIITTNITAMTDYCDENNSYLLDVDEYRNYSETPEWNQKFQCPFYKRESFPKLGLNKAKELGRIMRHVLNNQDEANNKSKALRHKVQTEYNMDSCVKQAIAYLGELK